MTRARDVANLIGSGNFSSTTFTATAGQTAFTISHTQGFVQVFMNGLLLDETVDYTSNGSAITLTSGAAAGDEIEVVKYNTFSVGDAIPASGGTFTGNVGFGAAPTRQVHIAGNPSIMLMEDTGGGTNDKKAQLQVDTGVFEINSRNDDNSSLKDNILTAELDTGNIGIGTNSPSSYFADNLVVSAPADGGVTIASTANTNNAYLMFADGTTGSEAYRGYIGYSHTSPENMQVVSYGYTRFYTSADGSTASERMRIKSDGVLVVGDTGDIRGSSQTGCSVEPQGRIYMSRGTGTGGFSHLAFYNGNGAVGSVQTSGSATSYVTSSDYRLKENVTDISDGITRIKQLAPKRFNFIADADKTVDGFLAHEAQTVVPESVTGAKDEVDDDGNAVMQGIDQAKLVPLLTAALQEAIAKIEILETKVAALENK